MKENKEVGKEKLQGAYQGEAGKETRWLGNIEKTRTQ